MASYCCIQDCNEPQGTTNFNDEPGFAYADPNGVPPAGNYHLEYNSPCMDTGDGSYPDETDIDGDARVVNETVDRGADEVACTETSHASDLTGDGVVNMADFAVFSDAWLSQAGGSDPNWNPLCNLDPNGDSADVIDLADLKAFCESDPQSWLWVACWRTDLLQQQEQQMMMLPGGGEEMQTALPTAEIFSTETAVMPTETAVVEEWTVEEKSLEEQILDLTGCVEFLEQLWLEEPEIQQEIDPQAWQEFMDSVYQSLLELQAQDVQNEPSEQ